MRDFNATGGLLGYHEKQCLLELNDGAAKACPAAPRDFYWKIGITVRNLDAAVAHLHRLDWPVSDPLQFRDIGYLCHLRDPDGFSIELLQQRFQGRAQATTGDHPIGGQATLAHITLRVTNIVAARRLFENQLGMRLLSVQPVPDFDFCLYFYGWSDERLPHADLKAIENREWLWARPYALIELQHLEGPAERVRMAETDEAGFDGFGYAEPGSENISWVPVERLVGLI